MIVPAYVGLRPKRASGRTHERTTRRIARLRHQLSTQEKIDKQQETVALFRNRNITTAARYRGRTRTTRRRNPRHAHCVREMLNSAIELVDRLSYTRVRAEPRPVVEVQPSRGSELRVQSAEVERVGVQHGYSFVNTHGPPFVALVPLPQVPLMFPLDWRVSKALPRSIPSTQSQFRTSPTAVHVMLPRGYRASTVSPDAVKVVLPQFEEYVPSNRSPAAASGALMVGVVVVVVVPPLSLLLLQQPAAAKTDAARIVASRRMFMFPLSNVRTPSLGEVGNSLEELVPFGAHQRS